MGIFYIFFLFSYFSDSLFPHYLEGNFPGTRIIKLNGENPLP